MAVFDAILLAAGESRRMGKSKQMLEVDGMPLLLRTVKVLREAAVIRKLIVVLGANADQHLDALSHEEVHIVLNQRWQQGMGTSLHAGLEQLSVDDLPGGILLSVCDQPLLSATVIRNLTRAMEPGKIAAAEYAPGVVGTPAAFSIYFLNDLKSVPPEGGARQLFSRFSSRLITIPFPNGSLDLDTPEDYAQFRQQHGQRNTDKG